MIQDVGETWPEIYSIHCPHFVAETPIRRDLVAEDGLPRNPGGYEDINPVQILGIVRG